MNGMNLTDQEIKEALNSPMFCFPCYTCEYEGEITPRCNNYDKCGLWISWAKKQGLIEKN